MPANILLWNHHYNQHKKYSHQLQNCFMLLGSLTPNLQPETLAIPSLFSCVYSLASSRLWSKWNRAVWRFIHLDSSEKRTYRWLLDVQCTFMSPEYSYMGWLVHSHLWYWGLTLSTTCMCIVCLTHTEFNVINLLCLEEIFYEKAIVNPF